MSQVKFALCKGDEVMWEPLFFKYTSAVLALVGSLIGLAMYFIHDSLLPDNPALSHIISCLLFSCILASAGFISGRLIQNLYYCANTDQLTNLWNSRYFHTQLTIEIDKFKKNKASLCIALIDLDDFKIVNDTYGHIAGDEVLKSIATVLAGNTRDSDIVVRLGGDEFAIIFPETNLESASPIVERLRGMIESSIDCHQVTISVGVLLVPAEIEAAQLLKMVDDTLYKAKETKNLVVLNTFS